MKVIGFGDNVVDKYLHSQKMYPGGNCVNFSVNAKKLGFSSAYLGVFGNDEAAKHVIETLRDLDVETSYCLQFEGENGYSEVNLVDGDRVFVRDNDGGVSNEKPIILGEKELNYLKSFDLIHSSCYSKTEKELGKLKGLKGIVSFDFADNDIFREDSYLETVCPNIDFALFSGAHLRMSEIRELIKKAVYYGTRYVLVTRGTQGSVFYDGKTFFEGSANVVDPIDTMGCGDSFVTSFLTSLLENGWNKKNSPNPVTIQEGLKKASIYAANNCLIDGAFGYGIHF